MLADALTMLHDVWDGFREAANPPPKKRRVIVTHTSESAAKLMFEALLSYTSGQSLPQWKAREAIEAYWSTIPDGLEQPCPERLA